MIQPPGQNTTESREGIRAFAAALNGSTLTRIIFDEHQASMFFSSGQWIAIYFGLEYISEKSGETPKKFYVSGAPKDYDFMQVLGKDVVDAKEEIDQSMSIIFGDDLILKILKGENMLESYIIYFSELGDFVVV